MDDARREAGRGARRVERRGELRAGESGDPGGVALGGQLTRIARGRREQQRLGQQPVRLQAADGGARDIVVALRDEQVERAGAQQRKAVLGLVLADHAREVGVPRGELVDGRHDEPGGGARKRADHDLPAYGLVLGGELGLGGIELGDDAVGGGHEAVRAGVRRTRRPSRSSSATPAVALELREGLRDRRRRVADDGRDLGDRAAPRQLAQEPESPQIEHRSAQLTLRAKNRCLYLSSGHFILALSTLPATSPSRA